MTGRVRNQKMSGDYSNSRNIKIVQNTEKSPWNLTTCCHLESSKRLSASADLKNSPGVIKKKQKNRLETLIQTIRICIQDIGMELDIEKCSMLTMKIGQSEPAKGKDIPNQKCVKMLVEKENYKYLEILEDEGKKIAKITWEEWLCFTKPSPSTEF